MRAVAVLFLSLLGAAAAVSDTDAKTISVPTDAEFALVAGEVSVAANGEATVVHNERFYGSDRHPFALNFSNARVIAGATAQRSFESVGANIPLQSQPARPALALARLMDGKWSVSKDEYRYLMPSKGKGDYLTWSADQTQSIAWLPCVVTSRMRALQPADFAGDVSGLKGISVKELTALLANYKARPGEMRCSTMTPHQGNLLRWNKGVSAKLQGAKSGDRCEADVRINRAGFSESYRMTVKPESKGVESMCRGFIENNYFGADESPRAYSGKFRATYLEPARDLIEFTPERADGRTLFIGDIKERFDPDAFRNMGTDKTVPSYRFMLVDAGGKIISLSNDAPAAMEQLKRVSFSYGQILPAELSQGVMYVRGVGPDSVSELRSGEWASFVQLDSYGGYSPASSLAVKQHYRRGKRIPFADEQQGGGQ